MTPEELMKSDELMALELQKQFDEEENQMFNGCARALSPDLIAHPASPIEDRMSAFMDNALEPGFEEQISAQLLKHINKSGQSTSSFPQNSVDSNGANVHMADQPSTSSSRQADDLISEEYARRLQQEYDNESKFMSMGDSKNNWDPISEWRRLDDDEALNEALKASLLDQPCSSKSNFQFKNEQTEGTPNNSVQNSNHLSNQTTHSDELQNNDK